MGAEAAHLLNAVLLVVGLCRLWRQAFVGVQRAVWLLQRLWLLRVYANWVCRLWPAAGCQCVELIRGEQPVCLWLALSFCVGRCDNHRFAVAEQAPACFSLRRLSPRGPCAVRLRESTAKI